MALSFNAHHLLATHLHLLLSPSFNLVLLLAFGAAAFVGCWWSSPISLSPSPYLNLDLILSRFSLASARSFLISPPCLYLLFNLLILTLAITSGAFRLLKPPRDLDLTAVADLIDVIHPMKLAYYEFDITETPTQRLDLSQTDLNCCSSSHEAILDYEFQAATGCVSLQESVVQNSSLLTRPEDSMECHDDAFFLAACEGKIDSLCSSSSGIDPSSVSIQLAIDDETFNDSEETNFVCTQSTRPSPGGSIQFDNDSQICQARSEPDGNAEELENSAAAAAAAVNSYEENEEECELTAEELSARAEAFITEFRRKLLSTADDDHHNHG